MAQGKTPEILRIQEAVARLSMANTRRHRRLFCRIIANYLVHPNPVQVGNFLDLYSIALC